MQPLAAAAHNSGCRRQRRHNAPATRGRWLLGLLALASCAADTELPPLMSAPPADSDTSGPAERSPALLESSVLRSWSSAEREPYSFPAFPHGNKDFNNFIAACGSQPALPLERFDAPGSCEPGLVGHLIARDDGGPGVISRVYFTGGPDGPNARGRVLDERIRIYADDLSQPVYDHALAEWQDSDSPLTRWTSGALVSYASIPYQHSLRVLLDGLHVDSIYYYQVEARSQPPTAPDTPELPSEPLSFDQAVILAPGEQRVVFERNAAGQLQQLRFELGQTDVALLDQIDLVLEWDDLVQPAVDLPLGRVFASSQELRSFRTSMMSVVLDADLVTLSVELPMPFERHARVSLRNRGQLSHSLRVQLVGSSEPPAGSWGYLHARFNEAQGPFTPEQRFMAAAASGKGKLVGISMFLDGRGFAARGTPHPISFLEGDPMLTLDGKLALHGTGTEDFFNSGWYFQDGPFEAPFGALVSTATDLAAGTARLTALRWLLGDNAFEFSNSLTLQFEYGAFEPLAAHHYAAVAFFYLR
jgi:hypothetical protein